MYHTQGSFYIVKKIQNKDVILVHFWRCGGETKPKTYD